jgi:hypothetical protein
MATPTASPAPNPSAQSTPLSYSSDPTLYLYTSLTAGSSHIITATSRLETILKAHKIPFRALDVATDEKARMLWGRRSKGKKLPGLVRMGLVVGDLEEVEEWNEYDELEDVLAEVLEGGRGGGDAGIGGGGTPTKSTGVTGGMMGGGYGGGGTPLKNVEGADVGAEVKAKEDTTTKPGTNIDTPTKGGVIPTPLTLTLQQAGQEAAQKAVENKSKSKEVPKDELRAFPMVMSPPLPDVEDPPDHSVSGAGELIGSRGKNVVSSPPDEEVDDGLAGTLRKEDDDKEEQAAKKLHDSATVPPPTQVDESTAHSDTPSTPTTTATATVTGITAVLSTDTEAEKAPSSPPAQLTAKATSPPHPHPTISTSSAPPLSHTSSHASTTSIRSTSASGSVTHMHHGQSHTHEIPNSPSFSPRATQHRGSSISLASDEEIKEIERSQAIQEEGEDGETEDSEVPTMTIKTAEGEPDIDVNVNVNVNVQGEDGESESAIIEDESEVKAALAARIRQELGLGPRPASGIPPSVMSMAMGGGKGVTRSLSVNERKQVGQEEKHISFFMDKNHWKGREGGKAPKPADVAGEGDVTSPVEEGAKEKVANPVDVEEGEKEKGEGIKEEGAKEVEKSGESV